VVENEEFWILVMRLEAFWLCAELCFHVRPETFRPFIGSTHCFWVRGMDLVLELVVGCIILVFDMVLLMLLL